MRDKAQVTTSLTARTGVVYLHSVVPQGSNQIENGGYYNYVDIEEPDLGELLLLRQSRLTKK